MRRDAYLGEGRDGPVVARKLFAGAASAEGGRVARHRRRRHLDRRRRFARDVQPLRERKAQRGERKGNRHRGQCLGQRGTRLLDQQGRFDGLGAYVRHVRQAGCGEADAAGHHGEQVPLHGIQGRGGRLGIAALDSAVQSFLLRRHDGGRRGDPGPADGRQPAVPAADRRRRRLELGRGNAGPARVRRPGAGRVFRTLRRQPLVFREGAPVPDGDRDRDCRKCAAFWLQRRIRRHPRLLQSWHERQAVVSWQGV